MRTLIVGYGEIGKSLKQVLDKKYTVEVKDIEDKECGKIEIMHICFPYSEFFVGECRRLIKKYRPKYSVIHSTVPIGTTALCGKEIRYSPVRGKHPNLDNALKTFVKYISGKPSKRLEQYFLDVGIPIKFCGKPEDLEAAKILSTTKYGWDIIFCKEVKRICNSLNLDFNIVYSDWTKTYNEGYLAMGSNKYIRPILEPMNGAIGGHCVIQNCNLLDDFITNFLRNRNDKYLKTDFINGTLDKEIKYDN